jgi:hypothetical protein
LPQRSGAAAVVSKPVPEPAREVVSAAPAELPALSRDPFLTPEEEAALSRPPETPAPPSRPKAPRPELRLEALIVPDDGSRKVAIVNGLPFAEGERIGDEELAAIERDHVDLVSPNGVRRRLHFERGQKRAAPAAADRAPRAPAREAMQRSDRR